MDSAHETRQPTVCGWQRLQTIAVHFFGRFALSATAVLLASVSTVRAEDWPQWLGPKRDAVWREEGVVEKFPQGGPKVLWRAKVSAGYSGPAVADGKVYVMDRVLAKDVKNHNES